MFFYIHLISTLSYFSNDGRLLQKEEVRNLHDAYLEIEVDNNNMKLNLTRTFVSNEQKTCIFSLKTLKGYGVYDVCLETGSFYDKDNVIEIRNGKIEVIKKEDSLAKEKKVVKIFLLNENKRVKRYGNELKDLTKKIFAVAKSFIEKESFDGFEIELVLHGIVNIDRENMMDWNIYDVFNEKNTSEEKINYGEFILKEIKKNIFSNVKEKLRNIDDVVKEEEFAVKSLYPIKKGLREKVNQPILDNETEKKLRNIGVLNPIKIDTKKERGKIDFYKLISKFTSQFNEEEISDFFNQKVSNDFKSPESLEKFADFLEPIKNDPKNKGTLFSTSNLIILLTEKEDNSNIEGLTFIGGACSTNDSYSIIRLKANDSLFYHGKVMAHEILHSLNATHDNEEINKLMEKQGCTTCMEDDRKISENTKKQIYEFILNQDSSCFEKYNLCGNGILDEGEECDPGSPYGSECCTSTCKLRVNSECDDSNGKCCKDCKLLSKNTKCGNEEGMNECENEAVCTGKSPICFESLKEDGFPCSDGICKKGVCQNRNLMCERIDRKFDKTCNAADTCQLVCVDSKNRCNLMGAILKDLQSPLDLPDGIPCKVNGIKGKCSSGKCEVGGGYEKYFLVVGALSMVLIVVLIIILGFM